MRSEGTGCAKLWRIIDGEKGQCQIETLPKRAKGEGIEGEETRRQGRQRQRQRGFLTIVLLVSLDKRAHLIVP